jgi:TfoX/Sxy family transcriptional regulator of competence genes
MPFDENLAIRVRAALDDVDVIEKQMFGGLAFMINGHMACGVIKDRLVLRIGEAYEAALRKPHTEPMTFTGKPLKGMIYVRPEGTKAGKSLAAWVKQAVDHALSLPRSKKKARA